MEWIGNLPSYGLPWWAVFVLMLLTWLSKYGIDSWVRYRKAELEERQYDDGETKAGYQALVTELKNRIEKLEGIVDRQSTKLDAATEAHAKCEIEQERLRGELNVMKEKVAALERHDKANAQNVEQLKQAVQEVEKNA